MRKLTSVILSLVLLITVFAPCSVFADAVKPLTEIGEIEIDEKAGYEIRFVYASKEYCIEYTEMGESDLQFVLEVFSDKNLIFSDNQDREMPEDGFFNPVIKEDNINYHIYFDSEIVYIYTWNPLVEDGYYEGFFEYKDSKIYDELIEYLYALISEEKTEEPEEEPSNEEPTEKPTENETEKNEVDKRKNLVKIDSFEKLYSGEMYLEKLEEDFEWGLCTYCRDVEEVTTFYLKYGETRNEEYLFISDEVNRVKNTVIFNLTNKKGKQITIAKDSDEGFEFDQTVNYLYDYKIKVNLNGNETAKDIVVSYKHKSESDFTKEIIDMEDYKEIGKLQSELFANNFGQDVIDSGKTEIEINQDDKKGDEKYEDIKDVPYQREINIVKSLGLMQGYDDDTFKSEKTLTRAEAAAIMVRILNLEEKALPGETIFTDVESSHWASGYINVAVEEGIINGQGDGTFAPEEKVTYHQFVKMLVCALGYEPMAEANGSWAGFGYIFAGSKIGLTKGITGTSNENITREKAARLIFRALTVDLMEEAETSSGVNGKLYRILEDKCILTEHLGYQKIEGFVWEFDITGEITIKRNYAAEPYYEAGQKISFISADENIQNLVNENVIAYLMPPEEGIKTEDAYIAIVDKME
ncbi:MAG: S-layer homology domain-containing protein [Clostridia bacterium]